MKIRELFSVKDKRFLITAGHTGVGRMIAEGIVENGGIVVICGRREELVKHTAASLKCRGFAADISTDAGIQKCVDMISATTGEIDVLINCAGTSYSRQLDEYTEEGWDEVIGINLTAPFFMTQAFLPYLRGTKEQPAVIINIGSTEGTLAGVTDIYAYNASKAGLMHLPFKVQETLARRYINWNTLNLGPFDTDLLSIVDPTPDKVNIKKHNPQRRVGTKNEIIGPIIYLSSKAGQYIKGRMIEVSGGISAYLGNYMTGEHYFNHHLGQWEPIENRTYPDKRRQQ